MRNEKTVSETLRRILDLEECLNSITELKNKAFEVFSPDFYIDNMTYYFEEYWERLMYWISDSDRLNENFGYLELQNCQTINSAFENIMNSSINRNEFAEILAESRESVEKYIKELETQIYKEQEKLNELYDEFAHNSGDLSYIFRDSQIKQLIMNKFLQV